VGKILYKGKGWKEPDEEQKKQIDMGEATAAASISVNDRSTHDHHWSLANQRMKQDSSVKSTGIEKPIAIGEDIQTGEKISVPQDALYSGTYVIGVQGSGKTSILTTIGLSQMEAGDSVIVLDPTGDMIRDIISRMPEERIQDTYMLSLKEDKFPFSMSVFSYPQQTQGIKQLELEQGTRNQIYSAFEKLWPETRSGMFFRKMLRNIIPILLDHPQFTLLHVPRFFRDAAFRQHILAGMPDQDVLPFWQDYSQWSRSRKERETQPFLDRVDELLVSDKYIKYFICQKRGLIDIRQAIIERKNLLIHLPLDELPYKNAARTIGIFFMMQIYAATFSFANMPRNKRPGFTLLVDEFSKWATGSSDEFRDLFSFGRKYGIKQVLCHQYLGQLDEENMGSLKQAMTTAHTVIALRTNRDDSPYLSHLFAGYEYEDYGEEEEEDEEEEVFTRKPTIIDTEPTKEMKYHKDPLVRDFYVRYVAPLEVGARWGQNILPRKYDFGFGEVYFEQTTIREILRRLNRLLYDTQVAGAIDETALHTFVYESYVPAMGSYGQLPYDMIPDPEGIRKSQALCKQAQAERDAIDLLPQREASAWKRIQAREEELKQIMIEQEKNLAEWERRYPKLYQDFAKTIYDYNLEGTYVNTDGKVWMIERIEGGHIFLRGKPIKHIKEAIAQDKDLLFDIKKERKERQENVKILDAQCSATPTEKKVERTDVLVEAERILRRVLWALIQDPIAVDRAEVEREREKWEKEQERKRLEREKRRQEREEQAHKVLSASEVAGILPKLENRQAFVKIASEVYRMRTINLPAPVAWEEMTQRWNTILAQTKRTYCRGRKEVERELAEALTFAPASDQNASENGQPSSTPQPERIHQDKPSVAQPQPTKDLFDRLDEMRRE
jgi:hypothetical protein